MKTRVEMSEIIQLDKRRKELNSLNLEEIDFIDEDGNIVDIKPKTIDEFKYTGLGMFDFIISGFYLEGYKTKVCHQHAPNAFKTIDVEISTEWKPKYESAYSTFEQFVGIQFGDILYTMLEEKFKK